MKETDEIIQSIEKLGMTTCRVYKTPAAKNLEATLFLGHIYGIP